MVGFFQSIRDQINKTRIDADKLVERIAKLRDEFADAQSTMAATLQRFGALTPETEKASEIGRAHV